MNQFGLKAFTLAIENVPDLLQGEFLGSLKLGPLSRGE